MKCGHVQRAGHTWQRHKPPPQLCRAGDKKICGGWLRLVIATQVYTWYSKTKVSFENSRGNSSSPPPPRTLRPCLLYWKVFTMIIWSLIMLIDTCQHVHHLLWIYSWHFVFIDNLLSMQVLPPPDDSQLLQNYSTFKKRGWKGSVNKLKMPALIQMYHILWACWESQKKIYYYRRKKNTFKQNTCRAYGIILSQKYESINNILITRSTIQIVSILTRL